MDQLDLRILESVVIVKDPSATESETTKIVVKTIFSESSSRINLNRHNFKACNTAATQWNRC